MPEATISSLQSELDDVLDDVSSVQDILAECYQPESTREDLAQAVGRALDLLEDYGEADEDEGDEDYENGD
jgi:hypothetical protein